MDAASSAREEHGFREELMRPCKVRMEREMQFRTGGRAVIRLLETTSSQGTHNILVETDTLELNIKSPLSRAGHGECEQVPQSRADIDGLSGGDRAWQQGQQLPGGDRAWQQGQQLPGGDRAWQQGQQFPGGDRAWQQGQQLPGGDRAWQQDGQQLSGGDRAWQSRQIPGGDRAWQDQRDMSGSRMMAKGRRK